MRLLTGLIASAIMAGQVAAQSPGALIYKPQDDWESVQGTRNYSSFVYRDFNRNGIYDIGDRPMSAVFTALARDGKGLHLEMSNANGFGNFSTGLGDEGAIINQGGSYLFEVVTPPGWLVTSGNRQQELDLIEKPGSFTGLEFSDMLVPVGLAPKMVITGGYDGEEAQELALLKDEETVFSGTIEPGDTFSFAVDPETDYRIALDDWSRAVEVGHDPVHVGVLRPLATAIESESGVSVITFEDVSTNGLFKIPNGYGGLNWKDLNQIRRDFTGGSQGYVNGVTSGNRMAYTTNGRPGQILSDTPFDLLSVEMSVAWRDAEGQDVLVEAWQGDDKVHEEVVNPSALGPLRYAPALLQITRVQFTPIRNWQLILDDVRLSK